MVSLECPARKQLKRLREALDAVFATGDAKAVHNVRVACRRLNEMLNLMHIWHGGDKARRLRKSFKRTRRAFQDVRDLDVLLASLCEPSTRERLASHELAQLEGELTRKREQEFIRAQRKCLRGNPDRAIKQATKFCKTFERAKGDKLPPLQDELGRMFRERAVTLLTSDPRHGETSDLHQVRIRLKRLRYVAELIQRLDTGLSDELIETFAGVQELLGRWHDHLVAADLVAGVALRPEALHCQTEWSARLLDYAAFRLGMAEAHRRSVVDAWGQLEQSLYRTAMAPCSAAPAAQESTGTSQPAAVPSHGPTP